MDLTVGQQSDALRPLHRSCSLASSCQQLLTVGSVSSGSLWSVLQRVSSPGCGGDWPSSFLSYSLATWVKRLYLMCVFWNSSSSFCLHFQFWQLYNGITLFRMSQLPECKEWQVCVGHRIKTLVELMSRHSGWTVIRFNQKSKTLCFLIVCVCTGADVRLFLHGSLHGKLPHDSCCCLPEIQEQSGKVKNLIEVNNPSSSVTLL